MKKPLNEKQLREIISKLIKEAGNEESFIFDLELANDSLKILNEGPESSIKTIVTLLLDPKTATREIPNLLMGLKQQALKYPHLAHLIPKSLATKIGLSGVSTALQTIAKSAPKGGGGGGSSGFYRHAFKSAPKGGALVPYTGTAAKELVKQGGKWATARGAAMWLGRAAMGTMTIVGWGVTAYMVGSWLYKKYGVDEGKVSAQEALNRIQNNPRQVAGYVRDFAAANGKFPLILQGNPPEVRVFNTKQERKDFMAGYGTSNQPAAAPGQAPGTGIDFGGVWDSVTDFFGGGTATAPAPTRRRRRRGGRRRFPAGLKYKSYDEFYQAIDATKGRRIYDSLVKALGRRDYTWGPKHRKAYKMLASLKMRGADVRGGFKELPDGTRVYDKRKPKALQPSAEGESLESFKKKSPFTISEGVTPEEQKYDRLMEQLLKELKKS